MLHESKVLDRLEIQDLLSRYCHLLDARNWSGFKSLFTEQASLDFRAFDGADAGLDEFIRDLQERLAWTYKTQHSVSTTMVDFQDDQASTSSQGQIAVMWINRFGDKQVAFIGVQYRNKLLRQAAGWKIDRHVVECSWSDNVPHDRWIRKFAFKPALSSDASRVPK